MPRKKKIDKIMPPGKEPYYAYTVIGLKKKIQDIGLEKGLDLSAMTNLILQEYVKSYERDKFEKFQ